MRCACPIWQGSLGGEYVRESLNMNRGARGAGSLSGTRRP